MISLEIAKALHLRREYIDLLARTASHRYKSYSVAKRTGGVRVIQHPARELKLLQRWLADNVLNKMPVHEAVYSYREGLSIRDVAMVHRRSNYLCRLDLKDYFPSIKDSDVQLWLKTSKLGLSVNDIDFISKIVCRYGQLTIGAPSSPVISNSILFDLDSRITNICEEESAIYTRYADDLYISCKKPEVIRNIVPRVAKVIREHKSPSLRINDKKTVHTSRKHKMMVTGLTITSEHMISIGRERKRNIHSMVFRYKAGILQEPQIAHLKGLLAYVKSVEPTLLAKLKEKYGSDVIRSIMKSNSGSRSK